MLWSASSLVRNCAHVNVLSRARPKPPATQLAAARGTRFHALVEKWAADGEPPMVDDLEMQGWVDLLASQWSPPRGIHTEIAWGLDGDGAFVDCVEMPPESHCYVPRDPKRLGSLLTAGRADAIYFGDNAILGVVDWKTGRWPAPIAAANLQVNAAGIALAQRFGARAYAPGIYYVRDGVWDWGEPVEIGSLAHAEMLADVKAAALLPETPIPGEWCGGCWERRNCTSAQTENR